MIRLETIHKQYWARGETISVLEKASAAFEPGLFAAIGGPSGCGKSTLLLMMGGLLHPDQGTVFLNNQDLFTLPPAQRAQGIGFVFQRFHLVPYLTVEENIRVAGVATHKPVDHKRVNELLDQFQITSRRRHVPGMLSVGEQQRTALARALYNRPLVLLADEPTGNLDPDNAAVVLDALTYFARQGGTVVMVTHHPEAAAKADRRWLIKNRSLQMEST